MSGTQSVRDLGWLRWKDPRAWMEPMRGERWRALVASERQRFEEAVSSAAGTPAALEATAAAFEAAGKEDDGASGWELQRGTLRLHVTPQAGGVLSWIFSRNPARDFPYAGDLAVGTGGLILTTEDQKGGQEVYGIVARSSRNGQKVWSYSANESHGGVGPTIAVLGRRVFATEAVGPLQYKRVICLDVETGKGRKVLFEDLHPSIHVRLIKGERECLFISVENAGYQALYHLLPTGACRRLSPEGVSFFPVGYGAGEGDRRHTPCYFVRRGSFAAPWEACGAPLERWNLPQQLADSGIHHCSLATGLLVLRRGALRALWRCGQRRGAHHLGDIMGNLQFNDWDAWWEGLGRDDGAVKCVVQVPGATPARGEIHLRNGLQLTKQPSAVYAAGRRVGTARSADGTPVTWVVCYNDQRAVEGLVVCGYGAYGLPTKLSTARWKPYLERGIAVGFALVRGGGDWDDAWAEAGRVAGKERGVEDFEACVRSIQAVMDIPPSRTAIYGRSAGGYLIGTTVARNPRGELAAAAYCEVPYVDVLRTASNPALPLTSLEYLEFGAPAQKVVDFEALLRLSPIEALGEKGAPGVFVVCRTGTEDRQVYAYESFKWVDALRGAGSVRGVRPRRKLLALTPAAGHFVRGSMAAIEKAEDYLLLVRELLGSE